MVDLNGLEKGDKVRRANEPDGPVYEVVEEPEENPLAGEVIQVELGGATIGDADQWTLVESEDGR